MWHPWFWSIIPPLPSRMKCILKIAFKINFILWNTIKSKGVHKQISLSLFFYFTLSPSLSFPLFTLSYLIIFSPCLSLSFLSPCISLSIFISLSTPLSLFLSLRCHHFQFFSLFCIILPGLPYQVWRGVNN